MTARKPRPSPVRSPSSYLRGDIEVMSLRSGNGVDCDTCGAKPGRLCVDVRNALRTLAYCHPARRKAGKQAADALVVARGRKR